MAGGDAGVNLAMRCRALGDVVVGEVAGAEAKKRL